MSDVKRVVVVRKRVVAPVADTGKKYSKSERKAYREAQIASGKRFHNFWWDEAKFSEFAAHCEATGVKPNEYLWGMIAREMGWAE